MAMLKKLFLYTCDFLRILLVRIPSSLIMTQRGRTIFLLLCWVAVVFGGVHFWLEAKELNTVSFSNEVEEIIENQNLANEIVIGRSVADAEGDNPEIHIFVSPQKFLQNTQGSVIHVSCFFEVVERMYLETDKTDSNYNLVKLYECRKSDEVFVFKEYLSLAKEDGSSAEMVSYDEDSMTLKMIDDLFRFAAAGCWLLGTIIIGVCLLFNADS